MDIRETLMRWRNRGDTDKPVVAVKSADMVEATDYAELKAGFFSRWDGATGQRNVVFAQGKTGTSTIAAGLKRAGLEPVFQIHTLAKAGLDRVEAQYSSRPNDSYPRHVWEAQWLRQHPPSESHPWLVVTSTRDPVARLVSVVFQQQSRWNKLSDGWTVQDLLGAVEAAFARDLKRLDTTGWDWFELQLTPLLGCSVYEFPFDRAVGVGLVETPHARLLMTRAESLDQASEGLTQLFGQPIVLKSENVGTTKDYGGLYEAVLDQFRPRREYLDKVYATRQVEHFYSADEIEASWSHWTRPLDHGSS